MAVAAVWSELVSAAGIPDLRGKENSHRTALSIRSVALLYSWPHGTREPWIAITEVARVTLPRWRSVLAVLAGGIAIVVAAGTWLGRGGLGERTPRGEIARVARAPVEHAPEGPKRILFGDLHVHTTYSFDAYNISLPMVQGEGAHPPADACDYARFCSGLDFWSINDHAEGLTPRQWRETREMVRECNAVAGDPASPDLVTYLGWEWTQIGETPDEHYGHKNVVLLETDDARVPLRPIASRRDLFPGGGNPYNAAVRFALIAAAPGDRGRQPYNDFALFVQDRAENRVCTEGRHVRELGEECVEHAPTPQGLFARLEAWETPYLVIPHGNTWGFYTPPLSSWDKQLRAHRDPERDEFLFEVFSGHGNTERYRPWRAVARDADGRLVCPAPSSGYEPECWRAGEIVRERCLAAGESVTECEARAVLARAHHVEGGDAGYVTVPGTRVEDWLDSGQCTDCYMPAYNYRPGGSAQYALALRDFEDGAPKRFRFGLIGSSDVHTARPGTGYKEIDRKRNTDTALARLGPPPVLREAEPEPRSLSIEEAGDFGPYFERFASFFGAGGLVAAHSAGRDRHSIWNALSRREVYATSGGRILLWFDLVDEAGEKLPMGSVTLRDTAPHFEVRALGSFVQKPGCPPDRVEALGAARLDRLCGGECYFPTDERRSIERIEVVRIRPRSRAQEDVADLIDDPWRVIECPATAEGCTARFSDPDFEAGERDSVYYVRALEAPSPTLNGEGLRCERDETGRCVSVRPCLADDRTPAADDCLAEVAERAWSSPIFVDHARDPASGAELPSGG